MDTKIKGDSNLKHFQLYGATLNNWMLVVKKKKKRAKCIINHEQICRYSQSH